MNKVKKCIYAFILLVPALLGLGWMDAAFTGWEDTIEYSPYIVIVQCTHSPEPTWVVDGIVNDNPFRLGRMGGITMTDVKLVSTLKSVPGRLAVGEVAPRLKAGNAMTLLSEYRPCQGDEYLLFATYFQDTNCFALSDYRVVPLGHSFDTNWLSGKNLNEQVKFMLQYRLDKLKQELKKGEEEKERLQQGVSTQTDTVTNPPSVVPKAAP